jgi:hypothetical protein
MSKTKLKFLKKITDPEHYEGIKNNRFLSWGWEVVGGVIT